MPELRTQIDLLLYQAFTRGLIFGCLSDERYSVDAFSQLTCTCHWLLSISAVSTEPILFVHDKLVSFVDVVPSLANSSKIKDDLGQEIFLWLKQCY